MTSIDDYRFAGKKVLIRVDFNVPMNDRLEITDDTRIVTALPTIRKILADGGAVILLTHLGRPKGRRNEKLSCRLLLPHLRKLLDQEVKFAGDCIGEQATKLANDLRPGEILLLENLRFHPEEAAGDEEFAKQLAGLGDVYVNDAFGTAHRAHASTFTIAKHFPFDKMFGYLVESEIRSIDKLRKEPQRPFTAILGGSKVSTKIHVIEALLDMVDTLVIGGGIAYTFVKAEGGQIGNSLVEPDYLPVVSKIRDRARLNNVRLYIPEDCIIGDRLDSDSKIEHCDVSSIPDGWSGLDIGIKSAEQIARIIEGSATILWNGPMGKFEVPLFANGTLKVAMAVARATDKGAYSLIGGGDTIAAVNRWALSHKMSYISTAGGALLEYLEGKKLPTIRAIKESYSVDDHDFNEKKALIRVDFNVPLDDQQQITDETRIITALPTIRKVLADGGSVVIMTHIGRPKGTRVDSLSTRHLTDRLEQLLDRPIKHAPDCIGAETRELVDSLRPGEVLLLENLRFHPEETAADEEFAKQLASFGDVYINNAFGTAHRAHASTYSIARHFARDQRMLGYLVEAEIHNIDRVLHKAQPPFVAVIGGSKISTKINIIEALLERVNSLVIGGGIVYTFVKAMGGQIGNSLVEDDYVQVAQAVIDRAQENQVELHLPTDCVIADSLSNDAEIRHCEIDKIPDGWMGLDIGLRSSESLSKVIEQARTVLWNGPMGVFEMSHFSMGTLRIAMAVARVTDKGAYSLIGGGDSIAAVNKYNLASKISYISTAGGALLEYIEGKELPSLRAIKGQFDTP